MEEARRRSRSRSPSSRHRSHRKHHDSRDRRDKEHRRHRSSERDSDGHDRKRRRTPDDSDHDRNRDRGRERRHPRDNDRSRGSDRDRDRERHRDSQSYNGHSSKVKSEEEVRSNTSLKLTSQQQLEALRRGREERDRTFIKQERQQAQFRSEGEDVQYQEWLSKEDEFMLLQAKKRAVIRVRGSRGKPIDSFVINLNLIEEDERPRLLGDDEIENEDLYVTEPDEVIKDLSGEEMEELKKDIEEYIRLDLSPRNLEYWKVTSFTNKLLTTGYYDYTERVPVEIDDIS